MAINHCCCSHYFIGWFTTGKEYAELEWPIDIAITLIWVVFGINMFGTILKEEKAIYM
jgi:cytochrome c oxidase cbb3-type subunit I/II